MEEEKLNITAAGRKELLKLTVDSRRFLKETALWARIVAVIDFVGLALSLVGSLAVLIGGWWADASLMMPGHSHIWLIWAGLAIALFGFYPAWQLLKFSSDLRRALQDNDEVFLAGAWRLAFRYFKFVFIYAAASCILGLLGALLSF